MKLNEWLKSVGYNAIENMIPPPMSAGTAASILTDELLGGEACVFSVPGEQALAMVVAAVVETYRPRPGLLTRIRALLRRAGEERP